VVPRSRVKPHEAREICRLYAEDGLTIEEVAARVGRSTGTVQRHLHLEGVDVAPQSLNRRPRSNQVPHAEMARTVELYEAGLSTPEVARELGMAPTGVRRRLDHAGKPRRSRSEVGRLTGLRHPHRMDAEVEACVVVLYELGVLTDEISRWLRVSRGAITRAVRRNGVPFRRQSQPRRAVTDEQQASKIGNGRLREAFLASGVPASEVAFRCGWLKDDGTADTSRVQRALGLRPDVSRGRSMIRQLVRSDIAALLAEAFGADPWEVGA
jgi:predicted transcriptional regulator